MAAAGLVLAWDASPAPTFLIVTPVVQGLLVAVAVSLLVDRLRIRSASVAMLLGLLCGEVSTGLVHYGHYLKFVLSDLPRLIREEPMARGQNELLLEMHTRDPFRFASGYILGPKTGYTGLPGFMALRNNLGTEFAGRRVAGWPLWIIWGAEALIVMAIPASLAAARAGEPFCRRCGDWYQEVEGAARLPGDAAEAIAGAIRQGDRAAPAELRRIYPFASGDDVVELTAIACPHCGAGLVDATRRAGHGRSARTTRVLDREPVDASMVGALGLGGPSA